MGCLSKSWTDRPGTNGHIIHPNDRGWQSPWKKGVGHLGKVLRRHLSQDTVFKQKPKRSDRASCWKPCSELFSPSSQPASRPVFSVFGEVPQTFLTPQPNPVALPDFSVLHLPIQLPFPGTPFPLPLQIQLQCPSTFSFPDHWAPLFWSSLCSWLSWPPRPPVFLPPGQSHSSSLNPAPRMAATPWLRLSSMCNKSKIYIRCSPFSKCKGTLCLKLDGPKVYISEV